MTDDKERNYNTICVQPHMIITELKETSPNSISSLHESCMFWMEELGFALY